MINDTLEYDKSSCTDRYYTMKEYIQSNLLGFQSTFKKEFNSAKNAYKICEDLANKLGDEVKRAESLINYGVSLYFCGRFIDSKKKIEEAYSITIKLFQNSDNLNYKQLYR